MDSADDNTNRRDGFLPALAISFLMLAAIAGLMKPDAVTGRAAPLALEAVRCPSRILSIY